MTVENKAIPTKKQLDFLSWEFGVFFHFGLRTFHPGYKDWDMQELHIEKFNPPSIDCDEWVKTIKDAGAKYAILTAKHHDGFANWPSKYTDFSVKNVSWKNGEGDVVEDFVTACRKYDVKVGIYYSPADYNIKEGSLTGKEFEDYFIAQVSELLTNYGKIDYLWFDGCGSEGITFNEQRIIDAIRSLQPEILIFNMWDPDTRWVGNESGYVGLDNSAVVDSVDFSILADSKEKLAKKKFLPGECDCRMRFSDWFTSNDVEEDTVKSIDELMGMYDSSVGKGANLLLNIGPESTGKLPKKDKERILEFGKALEERFSNPVFTVDYPEKTDNEYVFYIGQHTLINMIVIEEDITEGEAVKGFEVYTRNVHYTPTNIDGDLAYLGKTVGHKNICKFPTIYADKVTLKITDSDGDAKIKKVSIYYDK